MKIPKSQVKNIIVTGKSGSGKGTRAKVIAEIFGFKTISTGDIFREFVARYEAGETGKVAELGKLAADCFSRGVYCPNDITNEIFAEYFRQHQYKNCVLDGYPRDVEQARFLLELAKRNNSKIDLVVEVHRDDEDIIKSIAGRRVCNSCGSIYHITDKPPIEGKYCKCGSEVAAKDDAEDRMRARLVEFNERVAPMIAYLKEQGVPYVAVNGYLNPWTDEALMQSVVGAITQHIDLEERIYFITSREEKFREAKLVIPELEQLNVNLQEVQSLDSEEVIQNKLKEAFKYSSGPFIVEDVSVCLDCLNGLPGPLIKWFLKALGNDGLYGLVRKLGNERATVKCMIGYARTPESIRYFSGQVQGRIVEPKGTGFGWDPIFQLDGHDKTFGEMSPEEKNTVSMRRIALESLKLYLENKNK